MSGPESVGRLLVQRGLIDESALKRARSSGARSDARLLAHLLEKEGKTEAELAEALAESLGIPGIDLSHTAIDLAALDLVPRPVAESDLLLPLSTESGRLHIAVSATAQDNQALDEVHFVTGMLVSPYAALPGALEHAISASYDARERSEKVFRGAALGKGAPPHMAVLVPEPIEGELVLEEPPGGEKTGRVHRIAVEPVAIELAEEGEEEEEEILLETSAPDGPPRVLVVDDEPEILRLLEKTLAKSGLAVETATDGREAEQKLLGPPPDLVLLDAMLPHVHGFEICSRIKASPRLRGVPVIMMSAIYRGWRFAQDVRESYGADDYIEKPFHLQDLLRRVQEKLANPPQPPAQKQRAEVEKQVQEGVALLDARRLSEARPLLERALAADPFSAKAHLALARVLEQQGDVFRAINSYERAVELRPNNYAAHCSLAKRYLEKGFRRKAVESLERAISAAPDDKTRAPLRAQLLRLL